jgi:hypothetical protein
MPLLFSATWLGTWLIGRVLLWVGLLSREEASGFPNVPRPKS